MENTMHWGGGRKRGRCVKNGKKCDCDERMGSVMRAKMHRKDSRKNGRR